MSEARPQSESDANTAAVKAPLAFNPDAMLKGPELRKFTRRANFRRIACGFFIRVRRSQTTYALTRIAEVRSAEQPYVVAGRPVDTVLVTPIGNFQIDQCSSSEPTEAEIAKYCESLEITADTMEIMSNSQASEKAKFRQVDLTSTDAAAVIDSNTRLGRANINPVFEMTNKTRAVATRGLATGSELAGASPPEALTRALSEFVRSNSEDLPNRSLSQRPSFISGGRQSTQIAMDATQLDLSGGRFSQTQFGQSPDTSQADVHLPPPFEDSQPELDLKDPIVAAALTDPTIHRIAETNARFTEYVKANDRLESERRLVALTQRNVEANRIVTEKGNRNFATHARHGKLQESGLLWEIDHAKRVQLCKEYDEEKDGKEKKEEENKGKDDGKNKEDDGEEAERERLLDRCVELHRRHSIPGHKISAEVKQLARRASSENLEAMNASFGNANDNDDNPISPVMSGGGNSFLATPRTPGSIASPRFSGPPKTLAVLTPEESMMRLRVPSRGNVAELEAVGKKRLRPQ